ncbi:hypothetical protein ONE63_004023 [Megalurothrips usitatus]|uniref:DUF7044 domain-containing protein n=1 Tax=Megalurothrips usitatus TaxID=439358 RepID=A0AAV7X5M0_9NEOP|nr:hypothetical protein ONE63_004023 [Megalurothrips usitatus]
MALHRNEARVTQSILSGVASLGSNEGCTFPKQWEGQWFQLGPNTVTINGSSMVGKGNCVANEGDKYIIMEKNADGK